MRAPTSSPRTPSTPRAISQADYRLQQLAAELNLAAARLAREAADEVSAAHRAAALRRRGARSDQPHRLALARRERSGVSQRRLRRAGGRPMRSGARRSMAGGVDAILIETIFDTLNAKAALFAVRETLDELGVDLPIIVSGTITDASGRTLVRTDDRGVLEFDPAREARGGRTELRARRQAASALHRGALAHRRHLRVRLPERGVAERVRRIRRNLVRDRGDAARLRRERLRQHGGRMLRHHAGAYSRGRRGGGGHRAARAFRAIARACRLSGLEPLTIDAREPVRQCRRAHQRHRLGEVPQIDRGGRLRGRGRHRAPAGGERRADHRRQHGRGHARFAGGDGAASCA